ncbi:MAG: hypothetical protein KDC61_16735, partial [Saprospiraceae bacterium]|nr:hypothetical protein [Saprospiraceae bacterium]
VFAGIAATVIVLAGIKIQDAAGEQKRRKQACFEIHKKEAVKVFIPTLCAFRIRRPKKDRAAQDWNLAFSNLYMLVKQGRKSDIRAGKSNNCVSE